MLVGEVRRAVAGTGISWKLSGGSILSAGVTTNSKKRHVCRAICRMVRASSAVTVSRSGRGGDVLIQRAIAGDAVHNSPNASANGQVPSPQYAARATPAAAINSAPAMPR